jgi:electron transfer flavoprotein alpha/beta subunit
MRDILAAGKKPVETLDLDALGVAATDAAVRAVSCAKPNRQARKMTRIDTSDPAGAANELVAALRKDGLV